MLPRAILMTLLALFTPIFAYASASSSPDGDMINRAAHDFMAENHIPGMAVIVVAEGKPESHYYGYANLEKKRPVDNQTIFEIGSLSKLMTTLLFAERIDYAKMALTDPITQYLPDLPPAFSKITLQNLATHTSGLPFDVPSSVQNETDLHRYFEQIAPTLKPNTSWQYSNLGIGLLARAIENESHKSANQLYHDRIGEIINALSITLTVPKHAQQNVAVGYDKNNQAISPSHSVGLFPEAWAVKISAGDMQRFLATAVGVSGTPSSILYPMKMTQSAYVRLPHQSQGLAWMLKTPDISAPITQNQHSMPILETVSQPMFNGTLMIDKTGMAPGFTSYIAMLPDKQTGVVLLANKAIDLPSLEKLGRTLLLHLPQHSP